MILALANRVLRRGRDAPERGNARQAADVLPEVKTDERQLGFDLFMQLIYMASLATAKVTRDILFASAAQLKLSSTPYFRDVQTLASRLSIDYARACQMIADRTKTPEVSGLLLRMSGSLAAGEEESEFLTREAEVLAEQYAEKYERDVEALKKWTDAYAALIVSVGLIVVVSIISMMIYQVSTSFLVIVALTAISATGIGSWIIYITAPKEAFTRLSGLSSPLQRRAMFLFKVLFPALAAVAALVMLIGSFGMALLILGAALLPAGFLMNRDAKKMAKRDQDMAVMVRLLGAVTSAIGTTATEALGKIERRSMPGLEAEIEKLEIRLKAGLKTELCWARFVADNGTELIDRTVKIFTDSVNAGGEPGEIGEKAAFFAQRATLLREKRSLVAATFGYLVPPLHGSIVGLLVFIVTVLGLFSSTLAEQAPDTAGNAAAAAVPSLGLSTFTNLDTGFLNLLVTVTVVAMTIANGFVMGVVGGGHWLKLTYNFGMIAVISGGMLAFLLGVATSVFTAITQTPPT